MKSTQMKEIGLKWGEKGQSHLYKIAHHNDKIDDYIKLFNDVKLLRKTG
jgi:hypothetical protein